MRKGREMAISKSPISNLARLSLAALLSVCFVAPGEAQGQNTEKGATQVSHRKVAKSTEASALPAQVTRCLLYTSPSPRDRQKSRMPSSA